MDSNHRRRRNSRTPSGNILKDKVSEARTIFSSESVRHKPAFKAVLSPTIEDSQSVQTSQSPKRVITSRLSAFKSKHLNQHDQSGISDTESENYIMPPSTR